MRAFPTASEGQVVGALAAGLGPRFVGRTPLFPLQRCDGSVWIKREGLQATGSYFDRVASWQLAQLPAGLPLVVRGWTSHTVALLALAKRAGHRVSVVVDDASSPRLRALAQGYGPRVVRAKAGEIDAEVQREVDAGALLVSRLEVAAHLAALRELAAEVAEQRPATPRIWVIPAYAWNEAQAAALLSAMLGTRVEVHLVEDDGDDRERILSPCAAIRRTQLGHREGWLVSPLGAELVDRAIALAADSDQEVVVLVPEDGQRYLGWW